MERLVPSSSGRRKSAWASGSPQVDALITATSDLALVVDKSGIIRDVRHHGSDESLAQSEGWRGQALIDTVTIEARPKIEEMLREVATHGVSRQRQVNHPNRTGPDLPIAYTMVRLDAEGTTVAIGRDLRVISALQQRLLEAQQALERDYWQMRHIETRYRLLFQLSSEAVVIAEVGSLKIVDANPAAARVFGVPTNKLTGWSLANELDPKSLDALEEHLAVARARGDARDVEVRLRDKRTTLTLRAALMPQDSATRYLIQVNANGDGPGVLSRGRSTDTGDALRVLDGHPDAFLFATESGSIIYANRAFRELVQVATADQVQGSTLGQWLGRPGADAEYLLATLKTHGQARLFATSLRGSLGAVVEIELSAVLANGGREPMIGMVIRDVGRRLAAGPQGARDLTLAVEQLTTLVGRVSLRDLVRDTTALVERHFIEAALELSEQNRTTAAEILGVSRQSLYVKLRRYGTDIATGSPSAKSGTSGKLTAKKKKS